MARVRTTTDFKGIAYEFLQEGRGSSLAEFWDSIRGEVPIGISMSDDLIINLWNMTVKEFSEYKIREKILRELPAGSIVSWKNWDTRFFKVRDTKDRIVLRKASDKNVFYERYDKITCDAIEVFNKLIDK